MLTKERGPVWIACRCLVCCERFASLRCTAYCSGKCNFVGHIADAKQQLGHKLSRLEACVLERMKGFVEPEWWIEFCKPLANCEDEGELLTVDDLVARFKVENGLRW